MSLKFTHKDLKDDDYKPVGSLFMSIMDKDSELPRAHRAVKARHQFDRSLPYTQLCIYPDDSLTVRKETPVRGRRHYDQKYRHDDWNTVTPVQTPRTGRGHYGIFHEEELDYRLQAREEPTVSPRRKRYVPEPGRRAASADFSRYRGGDSASCAADTPVRAHTPRTVYKDHLGRGSLIPKEEPPTPRPVPPPMVLKPHKTSLRTFPERNLPSKEDKHLGVKIVQPPAHWKSVTEKQQEFLTFGVAHTDAPVNQTYRNESSVRIADHPTGIAKSPAREPVQHWRGRSRSANPMERKYDIITGRKLRY